MSDKNYLPWWRLDNAAKIFPSTSSAHDSKVFRFFCELKEDVDPAALQAALDKTMEMFPIYHCVLRRGWFWYYLEESPLPALARPDELLPCFPIYPSPQRSLLFRVLYYRRRISLEIYHVLSDGAGALDFLRVLVYEYLCIRHPDDKLSVNRVPVLGISDRQKETDSFQKYYEKPARRLASSPPAYQIPGNHLPKNQLSILEGNIPVKELLACARARGVTITELLTAVLLCSIYEGMSVRSRKRPVVVTVPVNLRNYFPSFSSRNFFAIIHVSYDFSKDNTSLDAVLTEVKREFKEKLSVDKLKAHMDSLCALEHNLPIRVVPLPVKDLRTPSPPPTASPPKPPRPPSPMLEGLPCRRASGSISGSLACSPAQGACRPAPCPSGTISSLPSPTPTAPGRQSGSSFRNSPGWGWR